MLGIFLMLAPPVESLLSLHFSANVMPGHSTVGAQHPLSRPPTTRRRSRISFEGMLHSKKSRKVDSEAARQSASVQSKDNTDAGAGAASSVSATAPAVGRATPASTATSKPLSSVKSHIDELLAVPAASAADAAQYEQHWTFLLQAELSKSMSDVQVY